MMLIKSLEHKPAGKLRLPLSVFYSFGHARVIKHDPESLQGQLQGHFDKSRLF